MSPSYHNDTTRSLYRWVVGFLLLALLSCTSGSPENEGQRKKLKKLSEMESEVEMLEGKIKDASNDPGLRYNLVSEYELLKSRVERAKENLKQKEAPH